MMWDEKNEFLLLGRGKTMLFDTFATINIGSKGKLEKIEIFTSALAIYEIDNAIWNQVSRRKKLTVEKGMESFGCGEGSFENLERFCLDTLWIF